MPAIVRLIDGIDVYDGLRNDLPEGWRCSNLLNGTFLTSGTVKVELRETGRGSKSLRELCARGMEARCPPNAPCPNPVCCDRKQMPYRFVSHARGQEGKVLQKASDSPCHFRTPKYTVPSVNLAGSTLRRSERLGDVDRAVTGWLVLPSDSVVPV